MPKTSQNTHLSKKTQAKSEELSPKKYASPQANQNGFATRFSGGMDEISPASPLERLFAVAVGGAIFVIALVTWGFLEV